MTASSDHLQAKHVLVVDEPAGVQTIVLDSPAYVIGREPSCAIVLSDPCVSRQHASFVRIRSSEGYRYRVFDGNSKGKLSKNGLLVNGDKVPSWDLNDGDVIQFGELTTATYRIVSDAEANALVNGNLTPAPDSAHSDDATVYLP